MCATRREAPHLLADGPAGAPGALPEPPAARPLRILHLEDSPSDAELAREHLVSEGIACEVLRVETRQQFEELLAAGGIDLVLADFQLPAFDGVTAFLLTRQVRPDTPFIMLTGKLGEEYAIDTLELGVTDYVLKQRLSRLAPAVRRALEEQRERRRRREAEERLRRHRQELEELVRRRTAELEERNAQLAVANRDLEMFIATASHDLRSPLVVIGGYARHLKRGAAARLEPDEAGMLDKVIGAVGRMEGLLDDLLGFFRASQGTPRRAAIDMEALVRDAFESLRPLIGERRVRLEVAALPQALGDPAMLRQVAVNLLANAVKFTAPRDAALIEVSGWEEADVAGFCVRDNGVGFDTGQGGRLFELFQRLHERSAFPGTGIGLATVRLIVEKHGGRTWASGAVDHGASFCLTLPRAPAPAGRAPAAPRAAGAG